MAVGSFCIGAFGRDNVGHFGTFLRSRVGFVWGEEGRTPRRQGAKDRDRGGAVGSFFQVRGSGTKGDIVGHFGTSWVRFVMGRKR